MVTSIDIDNETSTDETEVSSFPGPTYFSVIQKTAPIEDKILSEEKQRCFVERGHDWWLGDVFLPIPKKDLGISMIPCGDRSPPKRVILFHRI